MKNTALSLKKLSGVNEMCCVKSADFIQDLLALASDYDGDGNGLCWESYEEVANILKDKYPALFEGYKMLKEVEENAVC